MLTPIPVLADWVIVALSHLNGFAPRAQVLARVNVQFDEQLTTADCRPLPSNPNMPSWKNRAEAVRRHLVAAGFLKHKDDVTPGFWALTESGRLRAAQLPRPRDAMEPPRGLCSTFRALATDVSWTINQAMAVGLVPWETTFTDNLLLRLALSHPGQILLERLAPRREGTIGADWEWWIREGTTYMGFRIQAKRADPERGTFALTRKTTRGSQAELFEERCRSDRIPGLYCLYAGTGPTPSRLDRTGPCPHGHTDPSQWGCALLPVQTALRLLDRSISKTGPVLAEAWPWYHLVCCGQEARESGAVSYGHAFGFIQGLVHHELQVREGEGLANIGSDSGLEWLVAATDPPPDVRGYFERGRDRQLPFKRRAGVAGIVLLDVSRTLTQ